VELKERLAANPDGIIENLARDHGVTTLEATRMLPAQYCRWAGADDFGAVMADLTQWGEVLMVVHTPNIVLECKGAIPPGEFGRGYFNIHGADRRPHQGGALRRDRLRAPAVHGAR
jgi:putative heme utilization carrier protein HutX